VAVVRELLTGGDDSAGVPHQARGELPSALSEPAHAAQHYAAAGELVGDDPVHAAALPWRAGAALALLRAGQRRPAVEHAATHLEVARASGSPYAVATALRTLAATDAGPGRLGLLRRARASLDGVRADRLAAQVDTDLAGLLLLDPRPESAEEARVLLRHAEAYAGREELWPLQGRVRRLLERLGESPRRAHREALAVLTPGERRVAQLAADGLTNRQIAETLVVTVKAVEWHLSHVYRKLGITSRTRLAATLGAPT
ncbi:LuxR C-terminal-related transcriptional regulator, partial [Nocardioides sp. SYSU DS0663]|uniref:LuxR C-terminal-related transcriptional regulator n=1 Tax=Nocardioides sp. SYSU DS0663 TaxID=3416445 RepID=UPI003F4C0493